MSSTPNRIIWFNTALHQSGGGERLSLETVRAFEKAGVEAYYVVYDYNSDSVFEGSYHNERIISLGKIASFFEKIIWLRKVIQKINPTRIITQGTWNQVTHVFLATMGTPFQYDVHVFGSLFAFPPALEPTKYARVFRANFDEVRNSQESYISMVPEKLPPLSLARRLKLESASWVKYQAVRHARNVFVLSRRNGWETEKLYGRQATVLKGAFPESIFDYQPKVDIRYHLGLGSEKIILTVSRLAVNKRVDLCIRGFKLLAEKRSDVVLIVGGRGPESEYLKRLAVELGIEDRVRFIGYVSDEVLWDYFITADVFVHLDLADFDIAPLEALALGQKVVWGVEMEIDPEIQNSRIIHVAHPTSESVCNATDSALSTELSPSEVEAYKSKLVRYSWENYATQILSY